MLENVENFAQSLNDVSVLQAFCNQKSFRAGEIYCPRCGAMRRMDVKVLYSAGVFEEASKPAYREGPRPDYAKALVPSLFEYRCVQCETLFTAVICAGPNGKPLYLVVPSREGGLATPNTPKGVAFYLDQAHRASMTGAWSATMAMYRAALDHLLHEKGYVKGMTGQKLADLEADLAKGAAKAAWAKDIDPAFLAAIKNLGSGAIHTNDGEIAQQAVLDEQLFASVTAAFVEILDAVYERPVQRAARLKAMQDAEKTLKGTP
jgi:hypothetical protein